MPLTAATASPGILAPGTASLGVLTAVSAEGAAAVSVLPGLLDEGGSQISDEAAAIILAEDGT